MPNKATLLKVKIDPYV